MSESVTIPTPLEDLHSVTDEMAEKWDRGMKAGKLLAALEGRITRYDPRVTRIREALEHAPTDAIRDVLAERRRHVSEKGWTPEHDDAHVRCEMAAAAACYAVAPSPYSEEREWVYPDPPKNWPWHRSWWKPGFYRRNLVKACALLLAEIERWDRAIPSPTTNRED